MHFFILIFVLHTIVNIYLFIKGWKALPTSTLPRIIYSVLFFLIYISFTLAMLGRNHIPLGIQTVFYMAGTGWLACMLYLTLYFLLTDLIKLINKFIPFLPARWTKKPVWHRIQAISGYTFVFLLLAYGYYHFTHPSVVNKEIQIAKTGNAYKELKAVGVSDLHLGITVNKKRLKEYVKLINAQQPDIIFIAGDIIDNNLYPLNKEKMWEDLNQLSAPLGVYVCLGNHEYLSGLPESLDFFKKTSLNILRDEAALIDSTFYVVGRDDRHNRHRKSLSEIMKDLDPNYPTILLDHEPFHLEEAENNGIDFQFSGHTHNGQLYPLNLFIRRMFEVPYGYAKKGNTQYYITSGIGLWGPQFRIGTQSEAVVFNIKFN